MGSRNYGLDGVQILPLEGALLRETCASHCNEPTHECTAHCSPATGGECACTAHVADECIRCRKG